MITYVIPTRNRRTRLAETLDRLGDLGREAFPRGSEIVVVDDASDEPVAAPAALAGGVPVRVVRSDRQRGASARNLGATEAKGSWLMMLDDDSWPIGGPIESVARSASSDVAAIGVDIRLPDGSRERGGLPEVFVGCGALVRREAFLEVGGYDETFHYYAEEYDLCARLLAAGWRVRHDWKIQVHHAKVSQGRDMSAIVRRLVRNGGWVAQRYSPDVRRDHAVREVVERCRWIARREHAMDGFEAGLEDLRTSIEAQPRRPLDARQWARFTGAMAVQQTLRARPTIREARVALVEEGKHAAVIERALESAGVSIVPEDRADLLLVGTLSPGPLADAWGRRRDGDLPCVLPWQPDSFELAASAEVAA